MSDDAAGPGDDRDAGGESRPETAARTALERLGLSTYEAGVFVALEKLGRGTAREIAEATDVPRSQVYGAAEHIAAALDGYKIIVTKSTVPVGTNREIEARRAERTDHPFAVVSSPEFLRGGSAVYDTMHPDRIVIGARDASARQTVKDLYSPINTEFVLTTTESAEMIKYASNAFLATKISFINEMANICERVGAKVEEVAEGMGLDHRISAKFLNAGIGYGGSCFPKDTKALINTAEQVGYDLQIVKAAEAVNERQKLIVIDKLRDALGTLEGKTIGVLGLAFKPNTDDIREAPALKLIPQLIAEGAQVQAYDPKAMPRAKEALPGKVHYCDAPEAVAAGAHGVALLTEWEDFKAIDWAQVSTTMAEKFIIDGRNIFRQNKSELEQHGLTYLRVGSGSED